MCETQIPVEFERGDQGSAHAFEAGVAVGGFEHPPIGLFRGPDQYLGIPLRRQANGFGDGLHRDARGLFARLGPAHAVRQDEESAFRVDEAVVLVIGPDASFIGQREGFQHVHESARTSL